MRVGKRTKCLKPEARIAAGERGDSATFDAIY
jgi:hypothetical protein